MNTIPRPRRNIWFWLKLLCASGKIEKLVAANNARRNPQCRSHRTTAFFEMP
jgi:hypothetical protein